jgi:hypothetical protein
MLGIMRKLYYHTDLTADPIVVYELGRNSIPIKALNLLGFGAITINPNIYIPEGAIPTSGNLRGSSIGKEEYAHILQQRQDPDFYRNYISEYYQGFRYHGDLMVSYEHISYEQEAKIYAGIQDHYKWTPYGRYRYLDILPFLGMP